SIGKALAALKASGQEDNTIVIFCSDHAGVMPRSKRFLFDSGTHSPLIIRIPEKYKYLWPAAAPGTSIDRLVNFLDFPKTWLSITKSPIPRAMQGRIFLGPDAQPEPQYAFSFRGRMDERYDNQRSVRDKRFLYIKNYMPFVAWGQHLTYMWKLAAMQAWDKAHQAGKTDKITGRFFELKPNEELYDCVADPDNIVNLAQDPNYKNPLETMRQKLRDWQLEVHDAGLLPEAETDRRAMANKTTIYEMSQNRMLYDLPAYLDAADIALAGNPANKSRLVEYLKSGDSGLRYWGTVGFLTLKQADAADQRLLRSLLNDPCGEVRAMAAWDLILAGDTKSGYDCLNGLLKIATPVRLYALNVIDWMHLNSIEPFKSSLLAIPAETQSKKRQMKNEKLATATYEGDMRHYLLGMKDESRSAERELP
ncbi:MAG: sulfatase-like hydrolase/transferase, partial [Limisphaerales bacterium]